MITSVHISGFKSLADVSVELGFVNVFIGANGAGKSNVLEAIGVASAAISGQVDDESLGRRGVRLGLPALYKSSFRNLRTPSHIRLEVVGEFFGEIAEYKTNLYNPIERPTRRWKYKNELLKDSLASSGRSPKNTRGYDDTRSWVALKLAGTPAESTRAKLARYLEGYAIYAPDTPTLRGQEVDPQNREPVGLAGGNLPRAVRDILRLVQDRMELSRFIHETVDWVRDFGSATTVDLPIADGVPQMKTAIMFRDRYMGQWRNVLSGYDASKGVLYVLFCAALALHSRSPKFFAIDNFDQALNPRMARRLASQFCTWMITKEMQCLLTTHNPLVLDGLPLLDDRVRLFAVDRDGMGRTQIQRISVTEKMIMRSKQGTPLSQQWVSGHIGAVPDV